MTDQAARTEQESPLSRLRCRLGWHDYRYVGFQWVEDFPGCKSGHDHECSRCGKQAWFGSWGERRG